MNRKERDESVCLLITQCFSAHSGPERAIVVCDGSGIKPVSNVVNSFVFSEPQAEPQTMLSPFKPPSFKRMWLNKCHSERKETRSRSLIQRGIRIFVFFVCLFLCTDAQIRGRSSGIDGS